MNPARRVLMTADTVGGVWTYAIELAGALAHHGVEVVLATMGPAPTREMRRDAQAIPGLTLEVSRFRLEWMDDPWDDVRRAADWLLALELQHRPDVVHLNGYAHGDLPWRAPVLVVGHSCVLSWWEAVKGEPAPEAWSRYREAVSAGLAAADVVAAPTAAMLDALARHYGPLPPRIVIPNGRSPRSFAPDGKGPFLMSAGRVWDEAKNVGILDRVAPRLPWPVLVAGSLRHPSGRITRPSSLRHLGRLGAAELARWLGRAAIFVAPARYEPFGLGALEAGLSGCALVLGDLPSLREVWGDAALFIQPDDEDALADTLNALIADPDRRTRRTFRARARALQLTPERSARSYLRVYRSLARSPARRGAGRAEARP